MRRNNLTKYDAPLRIQYQWGYDAFKRGGRFTTVGKKQVYQELRPSIDPHTMQAREWHRGWNDAYHEQLEKVKKNEQPRGTS
tara:strand:- start:590 stop:835 length:246 start_codon:yes stop_codon:yes gene_type:complete